MLKDSKWGKQIISLQDDEGKWGIFHSMSQPTTTDCFTTEQALRRLERLGATKDDACICKAIRYMESCLKGERTIPDYQERNMTGICLRLSMCTGWLECTGTAVYSGIR